MEPQLPVVSPNAFKFRLLGILLVLIILLFIFAALNYFKILDFQIIKSNLFPNRSSEQQSIQKLTNDLQSLPVSLSLLKNPVVYQWRGSVEGNIVEKSSTSITISKNNNLITLPVKVGPNGTKFASPSGTLVKQLSVDEVRLGDYVRGDFFVSPLNKNKPFGAFFQIVQPTK